MQTTQSVKANATAFIEGLGMTVTTPFDIVAAMEEQFMKGPLLTPVNRNTTREQIMNSVEDVLSPMDQFVANRILASARWKQKTMLFTNFGRWLEEDEKKIVNAAKEGLKSVEDRLAAGYYATEKIKSRKAWKLEQARNQNASHHGPNVKAVKTGDKPKWDDAQIHELPPIVNGKAHEPAYYAIKLPDGRVVSLGSSAEGFPAKTNRYPSQALQNIAARLGVTMRGGDTAILNHLLDSPPIESVNDKGLTETNYKWLPSYTSAWQGKWIVYVGWKLNPKIAASSYWLDENGELTQFNPNFQMTPEDEGYEAPLTLSQLDYHLLCESSDLAVEDENGEVVEFMNEEEEFLTMFPQRESNETFIDFSQYCEDDAEMELFQSCSGVIERSEGGITLGDLESSQYVEYLSNGIKTAERTLQKLRNQETSDAVDEIIENMEIHLARLNRLDSYWNQFVGTQYNEAKPAQATFGAKGDFREPLKCLPFMSDEPLNLIEAPLAREVESMPEHRVVTYSWLNAISPKLIVKRELEARRGQVFKAIQEGSLKAQLAFSAAFEEALRA